jgi:hypothetical protein
MQTKTSPNVKHLRAMFAVDQEFVSYILSVLFLLHPWYSQCQWSCKLEAIGMGLAYGRDYSAVITLEVVHLWCFADFYAQIWGAKSAAAGWPSIFR